MGTPSYWAHHFVVANNSILKFQLSPSLFDFLICKIKFMRRIPDLNIDFPFQTFTSRSFTLFFSFNY